MINQESRIEYLLKNSNCFGITLYYLGKNYPITGIKEMLSQSISHERNFPDHIEEMEFMSILNKEYAEIQNPIRGDVVVYLNIYELSISNNYVIIPIHSGILLDKTHIFEQEKYRGSFQKIELEYKLYLYDYPIFFRDTNQSSFKEN